MSLYFLTGATGAIGSALVPVLLERPDTELRLLLRAGSEAELAHRLDGLFTFWGFGEREAALRARVQAVRGDVSLPRLGLEAGCHEDLVPRVTHIVHCAGNVRMNLPIEQARACSVRAAEEILAFAEACRTAGALAKVEFVSTVGVGGRLPRVPETWIDAPRAFHNTYEQAKAEAEDLVRPRALHDLPLTVHRPSMVVGDSVDGRIVHFQIFYHLCEFLSGRRTFGLFPPLGEARLDTVPADAVARAIAWSSTTAATAGAVLHECAGPEAAIGLLDLQRLVAERFGAHGIPTPRPRVLPQGLFLGLLRVAGLALDERTRRALGTLPVFLDYLATRQGFQSQVTAARLREAGLALPTPSDYLPVVLDRYLRQSAAAAQARPAERNKS